MNDKHIWLVTGGECYPITGESKELIEPLAFSSKELAKKWCEHYFEDKQLHYELDWEEANGAYYINTEPDSYFYLYVNNIEFIQEA